jgi:hypothetical protein
MVLHMAVVGLFSLNTCNGRCVLYARLLFTRAFIMSDNFMLHYLFYYFSVCASAFVVNVYLFFF